VNPVLSKDAHKWRKKLAWQFDSFCENGSLEPNDLWDDIKARKRQLWVVGDGMAAVLTTVRDDRLQTCVITHAAGENMRSWVHMISLIEDWARDIGAKRLEAIARPGWEKVLDMKKTHVVLEKRL